MRMLNINGLSELDALAMQPTIRVWKLLEIFIRMDFSWLIVLFRGSEASF